MSYWWHSWVGKRNNSQPLEGQWGLNYTMHMVQVGFMGGKGRPTLLTETPRDANLDQQTQRCRMLMRWCPQLLVKASFLLFHRMQRSPPSSCVVSWIKSWLNVSTLLQQWLQLDTSGYHGPAVAMRAPHEQRLSVWPRPHVLLLQGVAEKFGLCLSCFTGCVRTSVRCVWVPGAYGCLLSQCLLQGIDRQQEGLI